MRQIEQRAGDAHRAVRRGRHSGGQRAEHVDAARHAHRRHGRLVPRCAFDWRVAIALGRGAGELSSIAIAQDFVEFGCLMMFASRASLRDEFAVSTPEPERPASWRHAVVRWAPASPAQTSATAPSFRRLASIATPWVQDIARSVAERVLQAPTSYAFSPAAGAEVVR